MKDEFVYFPSSIQKYFACFTGVRAAKINYLGKKEITCSMESQ